MPFKISRKHGLIGNLLIWSCILVATLLVTATVYAKDQTPKDKKKIEVLYYDALNDVKIIKKNDFLLKITKNQKGLKIVHELGPYPEAYPGHLPPPKTHIDNQDKQDKQTE